MIASKVGPEKADKHRGGKNPLVLGVFAGSAAGNTPSAGQADSKSHGLL